LPPSVSRSAVAHYSVAARVLHWLTALLVVVAYIVSVGGPEARVYAPANDGARGLHELLGLSVAALTLVRLAWRVTVAPPESPAMPAWMRLAARLGHWAMYALLLLVPATAILGAWLEGHPLTVLAVGDVGPWLSASHALGATLADLHGWLGNALIWLAGAHAASALYHHFWRGDTVLRSMLPGR
jgi:cytochrome b561